MARLRRATLWTMGILLTPILLILLSAAAIYIPPVQRFVVKKVAQYASGKTRMDISVESVRLVFPLNLGVEGVRILRQNDSLPQLHDTIANVGRTVVSVRMLPLIGKKVIIDELELDDVACNTATFIPSMRVRAKMKLLRLSASGDDTASRDSRAGIDLGSSTVHLSQLDLNDAVVDIALSDTVPEDTVQKEPTLWFISANRLKINNASVTVHLPGDTIQVNAYMADLDAEHGNFDLGKSVYELGKLDWKDGRLAYDNNFKPHSTIITMPQKRQASGEKNLYSNGLDLNHISLEDITLGIDSIHYDSQLTAVKIRKCSFRERCGMEVTQLTGSLKLDTARVIVSELVLATPESTVKTNADVALNAFDKLRPGKLSLVVHGELGKQDLMMAMGAMPQSFRRQWPNYPLKVDGVLKGNIQRMTFTGLNLVLPSALKCKADGWIANLSDLQHLQADIDVDATTEWLDFLSALLGSSSATISIPRNINLKANLKANGNDYATRFRLVQGGGSLNGTAKIDASQMKYSAQLSAQRLPLQNVLPKMGLRPFSGNLTLEGCGTDYLSNSFRLNAYADVTSFAMSGYDLSNVTLNADMSQGKLHALLSSDNQLLRGSVTADGTVRKRIISGTVDCDVAYINLQRLQLTSFPMTAQLRGNINLDTDLADYYRVNGRIDEVMVEDSAETYKPEEVILCDLLTRTDTTHASVSCGDFSLLVNAQGGYKLLMHIGDDFTTELKRQMNDRHINQLTLRRSLPYARVAVSSGASNFFCQVLKKYGYEIGNVNMDLQSSPTDGLNGWLNAYTLAIDSIQIDTVRLRLTSDNTDMAYSVQVRNGERNPQYTFNALLNGGIHERGAFVDAKIYDADDQLGIATSLDAQMESDGVRLVMTGDDPVLGYKTFHVNRDNYAFLGSDNRVSANVKLTADDGTGVQVYTNDSTEALQDVTIGLHQFNLANVLSVIPYTPDIEGTMDGDFHVIQTAENLTVSSAINIDDMVYEHSPMGNVGTEFVYMPLEDGSHHVDGLLTVDEEQVAAIVGTYDARGTGLLDADITLERIPLSLVNGFIPDHIIGLRGFGEGKLTAKGSLSSLNVNGEVYLDSSYIVSEPYGVELSFDNDPVRIVGSHLLFDNFEMYSHNKEPLNMSGSLDFSDMDNMTLNLKMRARNYQIVDSKQTSRSEVFGKAFVDLYATINGPLSSLDMRGYLKVLGATNMTYILRDSPLSTDNQLDGLVEFTDFNDTTTVTTTKPELSGFNMSLSLSIDESAHIMAWLNSSGSNYVDLTGGGDLRLLYSASEMRLTGRYTLSNGEMKYSLPVIPLKTFTVQDGSYIEFTGNPYNPRLNITATEKTKCNVGDGNSTRSVDFVTGVKISKTLEDMGLEFIIDAPDDVTVYSQLQSMSVEERGKMAVTMLTTGMYLADGNTSAFTMNSALTAFLNSQINSISGSALRSLDLQLGVDNSTSGTGTSQTDYTFKFAKRFWNNRLNVIVGGKVSTGADAVNDEESILDNITLEYRLNQNSTQYLRLFYDRDTQDYLEGDVGEFGAGFTWRRKLQSFKNIFSWRNIIPMPARQNENKESNDSTTNATE